MPNDVADWTGLQRVNLIGASGAQLGDTSAAVLANDALTETISTSRTILSPGPAAAAASLKPAAGATIARVGALGAFTSGTNTAVTPPFGQATSAGNGLAVWVTSVGADPTTVAAGWAVVRLVTMGALRAALWARANCGAAEAAPAFTAAGGTAPMRAQAAEFSGLALAAMTDQTGGPAGGGGSVIVASNTGPDAQPGDLFLAAVNWPLDAAGTATFIDALDNSMTAVHAGDSGALAVANQSSFTYGIVPAAAAPVALGTADWPWDGFGQSRPAVGVQAAVALSAVFNKRWIITFLGFALTEQAAAGGADVQLLDGATVVFDMFIAVEATVQHTLPMVASGLAIAGTIGNSATARFAGAVAGCIQSVNVGGYQR